MGEGRAEEEGKLGAFGRVSVGRGRPVVVVVEGGVPARESAGGVCLYFWARGLLLWYRWI